MVWRIHLVELSKYSNNNISRPFSNSKVKSSKHYKKWEKREKWKSKEQATILKYRTKIPNNLNQE